MHPSHNNIIETPASDGLGYAVMAALVNAATLIVALCATRFNPLSFLVPESGTGGAAALFYLSFNAATPPRRLKTKEGKHLARRFNISLFVVSIPFLLTALYGLEMSRAMWNF